MTASDKETRTRDWEREAQVGLPAQRVTGGETRSGTKDGGVHPVRTRARSVFTSENATVPGTWRPSITTVTVSHPSVTCAFVTRSPRVLTKNPEPVPPRAAPLSATSRPFTLMAVPVHSVTWRPGRPLESQRS